MLRYVTRRTCFGIRFTVIIGGTNTESYFHWELLFNLSGNGYMQQTERLEEELFERFYSSIETWRSRSVIPEELVFNLYDDCDAFLDEKTLR